MVNFVVALLVLLILIFVSKKTTKSFFSVPSIFLIFWSIYFAFSYLVTKDEYNWSFHSIWFIIGLAVSLIIGFFIGNSIKVNEGYLPINLKKIDKKTMGLFICIGIAIAVLYPLMILRTYNASIKNILNIKFLLSFNNMIASDRYTGNFELGGISSIFLILVYAMPLIGGYLFNKFKIIGKLLCLATFFPGFLVLILINTKISIIGPTLLFVSGYITNLITMKKLKISKKTIIIGGLSFVILMGVLIVSMMMRTGSISLDVFNTILYKFKSYAFGSVPAFDYWIKNRDFQGLTFGQSTFLGIFDLIGLADKKIGVYEDYFYTRDIATNVYTVFRGLILDFDIIGSLAIFIILGIIFGFAKKKIDNCAAPLSVCITSLGLFFFFYGFIISCFTYNSFTFAFVIYYIFVYLSYFMDGD